MPTFAYCRVSTQEQTTQNQVIEIEARGYKIDRDRIVSETISGSSEAFKRPEFKRLVDRMGSGDQLVVLKLDRLGRDSIDVLDTINLLTSKGIKIVSLDLPIENLASSEGQLMLKLFSAVADFERSRIIERTQEGLARAKQQGTLLGRPPAIKTNSIVQMHKEKGLSQQQVADETELGIATVKRHWNIIITNDNKLRLSKKSRVLTID